MFAKRFLTAVALAAGLILPSTTSAEQTFITIGTGGVTGVYFPIGGAVCRLVNMDRKDHGIRCSVESTGGSVYNIRTLRAGELDFGVVQSDVQLAALKGSDDFESDAPYEDLRVVFSVHPEPVHVMVRADAGIETVTDMKGKRVNIGNPGSGTRALADVLLEAAGLVPDEFALAAELKSSEQAAALCNGRIDAAIWTAGLPNASATEATSSCYVNILDLTNWGMEKVLEANPAYGRVNIPGGLYPGNEEDITSWGPRATFVVDANAPDGVVYTVVKAVFENFEEFKGMHPAFGALSEGEMITRGLSAPLHPGAARYFTERGWM